MKLKTRNVILTTAVASALLTMAGAANAGTLTTTSATWATENFGSTFSATKAITPSAITYSMSSATNVNTGTAIYFIVRLAGGKFAAAPTTLTFAGTAPGAAYAGTISNDATTWQATITPTASASIGIGAFSWTPNAIDVIGVGGLGTAGATVTATVVVNTATTSTTALDSTNALPTTVDAPAPTGTIATSAAGIAATLDATMNAYAGRIDLTATPPSSGYRNTAGTVLTAVALGSVKFSDNTGTQLQSGTSGADYTILTGSTNAAITNAKIDVTPGSGQAFPIGATLAYDNVSSACTTMNGATAALTATTSITKVTVTVAAGSVISGTSVFVCMTAPSTGNTAAPITPTVTATLTPAASTDSGRSVTGTGFALVLNGSQVDVRNYIPLAVTGWTNFLRIINTGSVATAITAAVVNEATGAVGTAGTLVSSLAAGAATTLSATQIEAVIGAQTSTARPRIRIAGSTNGLDVQNFLFTPNGSFSNNMGKE